MVALFFGESLEGTEEGRKERYTKDQRRPTGRDRADAPARWLVELEELKRAVARIDPRSEIARKALSLGKLTVLVLIVKQRPVANE